jgi:hypothetical protein
MRSHGYSIFTSHPFKYMHTRGRGKIGFAVASQCTALGYSGTVQSSASAMKSLGLKHIQKLDIVHPNSDVPNLNAMLSSPEESKDMFCSLEVSNAFTTLFGMFVDICRSLIASSSVC